MIIVAGLGIRQMQPQTNNNVFSVPLVKVNSPTALSPLYPLSGVFISCCSAVIMNADLIGAKRDGALQCLYFRSEQGTLKVNKVMVNSLGDTLGKKQGVICSVNPTAIKAVLDVTRHLKHISICAFV